MKGFSSWEAEFEGLEDLRKYEEPSVTEDLL